MSGHSEAKAAASDASTKLAAERTRLAYGRTLLGWIRTSTTLITFGFSIYQFFRATRGAEAEGKYFVGPREFGLMMIFVGLIALFIAVVENRRDMQALKAQYPELRYSPERVLAVLVAILGLTGVLVALIRQ